MKPFFLFLGVTGEEISPCCQKFTSLDNLCGKFIAYCPSTFSYEGSVGIGEEDIDVEMNPDDGITPEAIAYKMHCLVNDFLAPDVTGDLSDSATEDNSGTDNAATAVTNGPKQDKDKSRMPRSYLMLRACWPVLTSPILANLLLILAHSLIQMTEDLPEMSARPSP